MKSVVRRMLVLATVMALMGLMTLGTALANPSPPTEGGNGAGKSGQCTGSAHERPTSCQSPGGVSENP